MYLWYSYHRRKFSFSRDLQASKYRQTDIPCKSRRGSGRSDSVLFNPESQLAVQRKKDRNKDSESRKLEGDSLRSCTRITSLRLSSELGRHTEVNHLRGMKFGHDKKTCIKYRFISISLFLIVHIQGGVVGYLLKITPKISPSADVSAETHHARTLFRNAANRAQRNRRTKLSDSSRNRISLGNSLESLTGNRPSFGNYSAAVDAVVNPTLRVRRGACGEPVCFTSIKIKRRQLPVSY